jgi:hypothetical protein
MLGAAVLAVNCASQQEALPLYLVRYHPLSVAAIAGLDNTLCMSHVNAVCRLADVLGMAHVAAAAAAAPPLPAAAAPTAPSCCDQSPNTQHLKQQQQQQQQCSAAAAASSTAEAAAADGSARAALAAFTAAERAGLASLPELWFNRGAVALHLGELGTALQVGQDTWLAVFCEMCGFHSAVHT